MTSRPNAPSPTVTGLLEGRMAAQNRGDGQAATAYYTDNAVMREMGEIPSVRRKGRDRIAARLERLHDAGLHLEPAGASIQYDRFVAEPVRFYDINEQATGAAIFIFRLDAHDKIANQWVMAHFD